MAGKIWRAGDERRSDEIALDRWLNLTYYLFCWRHRVANRRHENTVTRRAYGQAKPR
jgi:hypothetical protein